MKWTTSHSGPEGLRITSELLFNRAESPEQRRLMIIAAGHGVHTASTVANYLHLITAPYYTLSSTEQLVRDSFLFGTWLQSHDDLEYVRSIWSGLSNGN